MGLSAAQRGAFRGALSGASTENRSKSRGGLNRATGVLGTREVGVGDVGMKGGEGRHEKKKRRRTGGEAQAGGESATQSVPGPGTSGTREGGRAEPQAHPQAQAQAPVHTRDQDLAGAQALTPAETGRDPGKQDGRVGEEEGPASAGEGEGEEKEEQEGDLGSDEDKEDGATTESVAEKERRSWASLPPIPYTASQRILLVGEGDFSFARALVRRFKAQQGSNIVATCFDPPDLLFHKYEAAKAVIEELERDGVAVRYSVDATRIAQCLAVGKKKRGSKSDVLRQPFDRVVFNFPHVGLGIKDQAVNVEKNRQLILGFFLSAAPLLSQSGEIHVALKTCQPYTRWNVTALAHQTGILQLRSTAPFRPSSYPGYAHCRTIGYVEGLSSKDNEEVVGKSKVFAFGRQ